MIETHHVSPVYEYRDCRADETPQAYGERLGQELEAKIDALALMMTCQLEEENAMAVDLAQIQADVGRNAEAVHENDAGV